MNDNDADDIKAGDTPDAVKNPSQLDNEARIERFQSWRRAAKHHSSKWRETARQEYDMAAGEQWDERDKVALLDSMRQPIVFNRTAPMIDAVLGAEVLNRQDVNYIPRSIGRVKVAELLNAADDWARQNCDAEDEESDAFADAITCGMGWTETHMSYDQDAEGQIIISRVDPLEMWWDPNAKKRNITDRRYHFRKRAFDRQEFEEKFPGKYELIQSAQQNDHDADVGLDHRPPYDKYKNEEMDGGGNNTPLLYVEHWQWWEMEDAVTVSIPPQQPGGYPQTRGLSHQEYVQMATQMMQAGQMPPQAMKVQRRVYFECFVAGSVILTEPRRLKCGSFTFNAITGKRDRNRNTWYGIVRALMDPQKWANKWLTQMLHIINSNAKGGLIYEKGTFSNQRKAEDDWAKPDSMIEVQTGALARGALQPKPPPGLPVGHEKLLQFAIESFPQVTGINLELLGLVDREQAGVLEQQRKRSGYAILAIYFDALRRYRKLQGRVMVHYIQEYISDGRLIKIKGEDGYDQYVPLLRQPDAVEYDVIVDEAPMSQNQKDLVWGALVQLMPMLKDAPQAGQIVASLIEYSPLPSSVTQKIKQALTAPPSQDEIEAGQIQKAGAVADVKVKESTALLNQARAHKEIQPEVPTAPGMPEQPSEAEELLKRAQAMKTFADAEHVRAKIGRDQAGTVLDYANAAKVQQETALAPMRAQHEMALASKDREIAERKASQPTTRV